MKFQSQCHTCTFPCARCALPINTILTDVVAPYITEVQKITQQAPTAVTGNGMDMFTQNPAQLLALSANEQGDLILGYILFEIYQIETLRLGMTISEVDKLDTAQRAVNQIRQARSNNPNIPLEDQLAIVLAVWK